MSRKYRAEEEKLRNLYLDKSETKDKLRQQMERIYAPIIWDYSEISVRIQDLKQVRYEEAMQLIHKYFFTKDLLCVNAEIYEDELSMKSCAYAIQYIIKDGTSLCAIDELNEKLCGVLVLKVMNKRDYSGIFMRSFPAEGQAYLTIMKLINHINKENNIFERMDCERYLQYFLLCIHPGYRGSGLGVQMLNCGLRVAKSLKAQVISGIFNCGTLQKFAKELGMQCLYEINYVEWKDKSFKLIFDDPGAGNYSCGLYAMSIPEVLPTQKPVAKVEESLKVEESDEKLTRAAKRINKIKLAAKIKRQSALSLK